VISRATSSPSGVLAAAIFGVVTHHPRAGQHRRPPNEIAFVSGIGCSSRIPGYTTAYGFNTVHGRSLPIAQGIKLATRNSSCSWPAATATFFHRRRHVAHVIRRNIDITYIVMDNQIYGLTKGQLSPTSQRGRKTVTSSFGSLEDPVNPLLYVMGYGASYVAQGTPADMVGLAKIIEEGIVSPALRSSTSNHLA